MEDGSVNDAERYITVKALKDVTYNTNYSVDYLSVASEQNVTLEGDLISDW